METQSVMYHHDAITGTHTPECMEGYMDMISEQYQQNHDHLSGIMERVAKDQGLILDDQMHHCHQQFTESYEDIEK